MAANGWHVIFSRPIFQLLIAFLSMDGALSELFSQSFEARALLEYRSYRDVQILRYSMPIDVSLASWEFKSNGSLHCPPKNVQVYLQYGSYPVFSPDNSSYPRLVVINRVDLRALEMQSDNQPVQLNISAPLPGDWFAVAFISEKNEQIAQKGLFRPCLAWLLSSLKTFKDETVISLEPGSSRQLSTSRTQNFRFYAPQNAWSARIALSKCAQDHHDSCPLIIRARPRALSTFIEHQDQVNCGKYSTCFLDTVPAEDDWNYLQVEPQTNGTVEYEIKADTAVCQQPSDSAREVAPMSQILKQPKVLKPRKSKKRNLTANALPPAAASILAVDPCWPHVPLVRTNEPGNFAFRFNQAPDENDTTTLVLNLTAHKTTMAKFNIHSIVDSGGTLVIELVLLPSINTTVSNVSLEACLQYGTRPKPSREKRCSSPMEAHINTSASDNQVGAILVPYPEAGPWYLSLYTKCYFHETELNESEVVDVPCSSDTIPIILQIKSNQCILGRCGRYGKCYQYMSGSFIFSTCVCTAGWKGWGCTDGRDAISNGQLLLYVLLLTLSNILFIPAIILAIHRHYFTEALVYLATMIFSALYHACDAEVFSVCVMRLSVMQFCDFYSAILSVWVTLIAMADLPHSFRSLAHMAGAVGVALGVEYDRTGLWVFVIPASVGLIFVLISWFYHCHHQRMCYPHKRVWVFCLLPGVLLAGTGLLLFTFLETSKNYPYVHSSWHASMALCILFLLPERRNHKGRQDINTCSYVRVEELSDISPSLDYGVYQHLLPPTP